MNKNPLDLLGITRANTQEMNDMEVIALARKLGKALLIAFHPGAARTAATQQELTRRFMEVSEAVAIVERDDATEQLAPFLRDLRTGKRHQIALALETEEKRTKKLEKLLETFSKHFGEFLAGMIESGIDRFPPWNLPPGTHLFMHDPVCSGGFRHAGQFLIRIQPDGSLHPMNILRVHKSGGAPKTHDESRDENTLQSGDNCFFLKDDKARAHIFEGEYIESATSDS